MHALLCPSASSRHLFPSVREADLSYCVDRRPSRARKQGRALVKCLNSALAGRDKGQGGAQELSLRLRGLLAAVRGGNGADGDTEGAEAARLVEGLVSRGAELSVAVDVRGVHAVL